MANEVNKKYQIDTEENKQFLRAEAPIIWGMTERRGRTETEKHGSPVVWHMCTVLVSC